MLAAARSSRAMMSSLFGGGSRAFTSKRVRVATEDNVAVVTLTRPEKMNALDMDMFRAVRDAALFLREAKDVRCVVVHGEGRAFCAGLDVKSVMSPLEASGNTEELLRREDGRVANLAQEVSYLWRTVPCPVIAAVHGVCIGGGFQIALGADVRVAAETTKFSVMEAKWGLIPDMGATLALRELVPRDVAIELTTTGRVFKAEEAKALGLATRVVPDGDHLASAMETAKQIARGSPDAAAAAKRLWHAAYDTPTDEAHDARLLRLETDLQRKLMGGWNQLACSLKGLGAPPVLTPGFAVRGDVWSQEADDEAEKRVLALLDGEDFGDEGAAPAREAAA